MKTNTRKQPSILDYLKKPEKKTSTVIEKTGVHAKLAEKETIKTPDKLLTVNIWSLTGKIIIIAEKPKAAKQIAYALTTHPLRRISNGIPYYIIPRGSSPIIIASAAGHLYGLHTEERGYPVFTYDWRPLYMIDKNARHTKKFLELLQRLCASASHYINACDYDIEGSVIGYLIIKYHGDTNKALRAKFSSLTREELREAFKKLHPLDTEMIEAGLARHELDWIWGINISRVLMSAIKEASGRRVILSAGRVQTPTLKYVVDRDIERNLFIPLPLYNLNVYIRKNGEDIHLDYKGEPLTSRLQAEEILSRIKQDKYLVVENYEDKTIYLHPPPAFNLGDLQEEAARIYGFSPYKTQSIAEKLYLDALISYPRTNSQKLPPTLNYRGILEKIAEQYGYSSYVKRLLAETKGYLKPVQGKKDDPAHPAIYPTGVKPGDLKPDEWKIYDLIVRRFMAAFAPKAVIRRSTVVLRPKSTPRIKFHATGQKIVEYGWLYYYPFSKPDEKYLPKFSIGEEVRISRAGLRRTYTRPPEPLTRIKILRWMEYSGIGTEATRARIIETLYKRKYLETRGGKTHATNLGLGVIDVLSEYFPEITSVELTRYFEEKMEEIRLGRIDRRRVVEEAKSTLIKLIAEFNHRKKDIGALLSYRLGFETPPEKCLLCNIEAYREGLCKYHHRALEVVKQTYEEWRKRENISWSEYVKAIKRLKSTGKWIIDVVKNMDKIGIG